MTDNESQWPAQYPREDWPAVPKGSAEPGDDRPTAAQDPAAIPYDTPARPYVPPAEGYVPVPPAGPHVPPAMPYAPPTGYHIPPGGYQVRPGGYQVPPGGYQVPPGGYQVPPGGYQVPPGGYHIPPGGYQVPSAGYQAQAQIIAGMRAASADRERAVDVLKAAFAEGRLTQDEYNDRMGRAYEAKTYGELAALTADLPAGAMPAVWPVPTYQPPAATNSLARASIVLGVAEFFTMGLTGVPAIICGHMAKREMRQTGQRGDGLATTGLVLGYMAVIFWGLFVALSIVKAII